MDSGGNFICIPSNHSYGAASSPVRTAPPLICCSQNGRAHITSHFEDGCASPRRRPLRPEGRAAVRRRRSPCLFLGISSVILCALVCGSSGSGNAGPDSGPEASASLHHCVDYTVQ